MQPLRKRCSIWTAALLLVACSSPSRSPILDPAFDPRSDPAFSN